MKRKSADWGWAELPAPAVHRIALLAGDASALGFCGSCRSFRRHRPTLRALVVLHSSSRFGRSEVPPLLRHPSLRDEFCMVLVRPGGAHRLVESLPDGIARALTHLWLEAVQDVEYLDVELRPGVRDCRPANLIEGPLDNYGTNLSSLRTLCVVQQAAGCTKDGEGDQRLAKCLIQLCRATSDTLRALSLDCYANKLSSNDVVTLFSSGMEGLHYVNVELLPRISFEEGPMRENYTFSLQRLVARCCPNLMQAAQAMPGIGAAS